MTIRWATLIVRLSTLRYGSWSPSRFQGSDAATRGLDQDAAYIVTALFLITACPCVELHGRAPRTALILGLTYPAAFTALFMAVIIASA